MIPDVVFLLEEHIETDERGEILDPTLRPPDIHVEIVSPDQSVRNAARNWSSPWPTAARSAG